MNILITGGTGFFGRHLIEYLEEDNDICWFGSGDVDLKKPISQIGAAGLFINRFDEIYHLAVKVKAGTYNIDHKGDIWLDNTLINTNIINYWKNYQSQATFITMGTSCAYSPKEEMHEENYLTGNPDMDLYGYAISKRDMLWGLKAIHEQYGLNYKYFIPNTLCGLNFEESDCHFQFDFIKKICAGKFMDKPVVFWGDGYQLRGMLDVNDAVKIITDSENFNNEVVNLSMGREYPLVNYARIICNIVGYDFNKIQWDKKAWTGVRSKDLINNKLKDFPFTKIEETLRKATEFHVRRTYNM